MSVVAIIQARMGSSRFPGKTLAPLWGRPLIEWVVRRTAAAKYIDKVVVATTTCTQDDELAAFCVRRGIPVFRGNEYNVLERFTMCAKAHDADFVVRITADDPLKDPDIIDKAVENILLSGADYCSNTIDVSYPEGLDVEVFTLAALLRTYAEARLASEREHVTPYMWKNPGRFLIAQFNMKPDLSAWRWTVDYPSDLKFITALLSKSGADISVDYRDLIIAVEQSPELLSMCIKETARNEGYLQSIAEE